MRKLYRDLAFCAGTGICGVLSACGGGGGTTTPPPPTTYTLTVASTGPASGVAITVTPADVNGAGNGTTSFTRTYDAPSTVTLTAPATSGASTFTSWSGCTTASATTCTVTLNANTTVTANYSATPVYTLTVNSTNPASGVTITATPADINSATSGNTSFTLTYSPAKTVTLTAPVTSNGSTFASWSGCDTATTVTCTVTVNANTTVTANYTLPNYILTVNSTNPASGVTIDYGNPLTGLVQLGTTSFTVTEPAGTTLVLTAPATAGGNAFASWTGCTSVSTVTCTVTLNAATAVTANYAVPTYTLTVDSTDPASGVLIDVAPADNNKQLSGTTSFTRIYNEGSTVTLTAPATAGINSCLLSRICGWFLVPVIFQVCDTLPFPSL